MRLLHSQHLTFEDFFDNESLPKYAILSHTWGEEEVTYKEMRKRPDEAASKKGYQKIKLCAEQAKKDGIDYIWVDTCCIDKSSSSELSEAINSMFHWYRDAHICYAYLHDVPAFSDSNAYESWIATFKNSRWFTRGWTLQELIAPRSLMFYSQRWFAMGSKADFAYYIQERTSIPMEVIFTGDFSQPCIAQRMSWAAGRSKSRKEDAAYCLMGLFDIKMPMLYGEGDRAFLRLQEEIIARSDDLSIFAWVSSESTFSSYRGLLAKQVSDFAECIDAQWESTQHNDSYHTTNKGISISLPLIQVDREHGGFIAVLEGVRMSKNQDEREAAIILQKVGPRQYARVYPRTLAPTISYSSSYERIDSSPFFVRQSIAMQSVNHTRAKGIVLVVHSTRKEIVDVQPQEDWDPDHLMLAFKGPRRSAPPRKGFFSLRIDSVLVNITVDAENAWGKVLHLDTESIRMPSPDGKTLEIIRCGIAQGLDIEVSLLRGLIKGESRMVLTVKKSRSLFSSITEV